MRLTLIPSLFVVPCVVLLQCSEGTHAFLTPLPCVTKTDTRLTAISSFDNDGADNSSLLFNQRRATLALLTSAAVAGTPLAAAVAEEESIFAPKFVQEYEDFSQTSEGWSFRDVKVGEGEAPSWGDRVVFDWSGYTIGYFGRPFEAKG